ncbi:hypothetical protein CSC17_0417 [Klebsiella oxytoca]|nr:hypothetical protein CSC17_0417 [Klebsiella oxytoca]
MRFVVVNCRVKKLNREDQHHGITNVTHCTWVNFQPEIWL